MEFLWSVFICAVVILGVSHFMTGVRCNSFKDALLTSVLYAIFAWVTGKILGIPAVLTTMLAGVLSVGLLVPFVAIFWGLLICSIALYLADQVVEGFEISSFGNTVLVAFVVGLGNFAFRLLGL